MKVPKSISLEETAWAQLKDLSDKSGESVSGLIEKAVSTEYGIETKSIWRPLDVIV